MFTEEKNNQRSVPHLLTLLASAVGGAEKAAEASFWDFSSVNLGVSSANLGPVSGSTGPGECPARNIRDLRRAYNIILFGGPTHEDIVKQAALEDQQITPSNKLLDGVRSACESNGDDDTLSNIHANVAVMSLELRQQRRFDPANALEGLVDLMVLRHGDQGVASIGRLLKLFAKLREHRVQSQDLEDWEVIGPCGRQILQRIYNGAYGKNPRTSRVEGRSTISSYPSASFFRYRRPGEDEQWPGHTNIALFPDDDKELLDTTRLSLLATPAANRYLLPNDCALHSDSTFAQSYTISALTVHPEGASVVHPGYDGMLWHSAAEFSSERGLSDLGQQSGLDRYLDEVATTPLSATDWTTCGMRGNSGGGRAVSSSPAWAATGGAPAISAMGNSTSDNLETKEATGRGEEGNGRGCGQETEQDHDNDIVGVLCGINPDVYSSATRELRLALSFPDLDNDPPDLLKETKARLVGSTRPSDGGATSGKHNGRNRMTRFHQLPTTEATTDQLPPRLQHQGTGSAAGDLDEESTVVREILKKHRLDPVGWEQAESEWNDPAVPKWVMESTPLVTEEGGSGCEAFELCYLSHFDVGTEWATGEGSSAMMDEAMMIHRALAALQGIPSEIFQYDTAHAFVRVLGLRRGIASQQQNSDEGVGEGLVPRVPGLSRRALLSLLEEFALAGTWYQRVDKFGARLSDRCASLGQVAQAFGVELRRQLTLLQAEILGVSMEFAPTNRDAVENVVEGDITCQWKGGINDRNGSPVVPSWTLTGALIRTIEVRRALRGLAEICGLAEKELRAEGGARGVVETFPRGATLLTYLYRVAETRTASRPGVRSGHVSATVMGDRESALALLRSATTPYLKMLRQWLWYGELREKDDPFGEFPWRCRELAGDPLGYGDGSKKKERWMEDGGDSFMSLAFSHNEASGFPCFLEGSTLEAAARAGKLMRMLKLSSPEFYATCSASPPPPLSLVFGSGALKSQEELFSRLHQQREAARRSAARAVQRPGTGVEIKWGSPGDSDGKQLLKKREELYVRRLESSPRSQGELGHSLRIEGSEKDLAARPTIAQVVDTVPLPASSSERGLLSFAEPSTSEKAEAASALREKYRLLYEETDAREVWARWRCRRRERLAEARASLRALYADEVVEWNAAVATGTKEMSIYGEKVDGAVEWSPHAMLADGSCSGDDLRNTDRSRTVEGEDIAICEWVEVKVVEPNFVGEEGHRVFPDSMMTSAIDAGNLSRLVTARKRTEGDETEERRGVSSNIDRDRERGRSKAAMHQIGLSDTHGNIKFSPVTIVQEPGGSSSGVTNMLGNWAGITLEESSEFAEQPPGKFSHIKIFENSSRSSAAMARALGVDRVGRDGAVRSPVCDSGPLVLQPDAGGGNIVDALPVSGKSFPRFGFEDEEPTPSGFFAVGKAGEKGIGETSLASFDRQTKEQQARPSRDSPSVDADASNACESREDREFAGFSPWMERCRDTEDSLEFDSPLPLEVLVRRCVQVPVLAQCRAIDSAALAFLVRGAGVAEHLVSLRSFLLGHGSDFLQDFTSRLLEGLFDGCVDWRSQINLDAAFAASAQAAGLSSRPLAKTFRYEVDTTNGGIFDGSFVSTGSVFSPYSSTDAHLERYSPFALSFVSPILTVPWPVGMLLPEGVLHIYRSIHRRLFDLQILLNRLCRLRLTLRELDALVMFRRNDGSRSAREVAPLSRDRGRLHWMHLFRHEMQHMADSLQVFFVEQTEVGWQNLVRTLSLAGGSESSDERAPEASLASLAAAHSRYISNMHVHMFLSSDRPCFTARSAIQRFSEVVCRVGQVTDGLLSGLYGSNPPPEALTMDKRASQVVSDAAFAELVASREMFVTARRSICRALEEICTTRGVDSARSLLDILGYS